MSRLNHIKDILCYKLWCQKSPIGKNWQIQEKIIFTELSYFQGPSQGYGSQKFLTQEDD